MDEEGCREKHRCQDVAHYTARANKPNDGRYQVGGDRREIKKDNKNLEVWDAGGIGVVVVVNHNQNTKYLKNSNPKYFIGSCLKK